MTIFSPHKQNYASGTPNNVERPLSPTNYELSISRTSTSICNRLPILTYQFREHQYEICQILPNTNHQFRKHPNAVCQTLLIINYQFRKHPQDLANVSRNSVRVKKSAQNFSRTPHYVHNFCLLHFLMSVFYLVINKFVNI